MRRRVSTIALLTLTTACGPVDTAGLELPSAAFADARTDYNDLEQGTLEIRTEVHNPNSVPLHFADISWELNVEGQGLWTQSDAPSDYVLGAYQTENKPLSVPLPFGALREMVGPDVATARWQLDGQARIQNTTGDELGVVSIDGQGEIDVPRAPQFSLQSLHIHHVQPGAGLLTATLFVRVHNPNDKTLFFDDFFGDLSQGASKLTGIDQGSLGSADGGEVGLIPLQLQLETANLGGFANLTDGATTSLTLAGDVSVDHPFGPPARVSVDITETVAIECGEPSWYLDEDGDGYGKGDAATHQCVMPTDRSPTNDDCDDGDEAVNPGAIEVCNAKDDNCNGVGDEAGAADEVLYYLDEDADGWGVPDQIFKSCNTPEGSFSQQVGDCDDSDPSRNPWKFDDCNGIDDDCDGKVDDDITGATDQRVCAGAWWEFDSQGTNGEGTLTNLWYSNDGLSVLQTYLPEGGSKGAWWTSAYNGTRLADFTYISYTAQRKLPADNRAQMASLQFSVDLNLEDDFESFDGWLVYEPYLFHGNTPPNTWHDWQPLDGGFWWAEPPDDVSQNPCPNGSPCSIEYFTSTYPNIGIGRHDGARMQLKSGSGWKGHKGHVDSIEIEVEGVNRVHDF